MDTTASIQIILSALKVRCVDISILMLEKCKKKSVDEGYPSDLISLHEGDTENLTFCEPIFDSENTPSNNGVNATR